MPRTAAAPAQDPIALITLQIPPLGAVCPGEGGIFAGIVFGDDGRPAYRLYLYEEAPAKRMNWQQALDWAKALEADGHKDFALPDRRDGAVLFANNHLLGIKGEWHWLSEAYAPDAGYAWLQGFNDGYQTSTRKDYDYRARAVRRVAI